MMNFPVKAMLLLTGLLFFAVKPTAAQIPQLKHAYNFKDGTANDRIGGAHGVLQGGAVIENGALVTSSAVQYLELPAGQIKINTYKALSLEAYVTAQKGNAVHTMLSYFGGSQNGNGVNYIYQSLKNGGGSKTSLVGKNLQNPWDTETSLMSRTLEDGEKHHLVTTFDDKELRFYIDGVLVGSKSVEFQPDNKIANLSNELAFLCKGGYNVDPAWQGQVYEFNIYEGVLDAATISASAQKYIPHLDLKQRAAFLKSTPSDLVVDASGELAKGVKGKGVFFAEVIPTELDQNNLIDAYLCLSDGPLHNWSDYSPSIRFSLYHGYVDVWDGKAHRRNEAAPIPVKVGQVYRCWLSVDVKKNTYSVYVQTPEADAPVLVAEDARFRKEVKKLTTWSAIHNSSIQADPLEVKAFSQVRAVGVYPQAYEASSPRVKASVFDALAPQGAEVISNPLHGFSSADLELRRIDRSSKETALYLRARHPLRNWINIPRDTYLRDRKTGEKIYLTDTEGIPIGLHVYPEADGYSDFKLIFPGLPADCESFDYGEDNGNWLVSNIRFVSRDELEDGILYGHWRDVDNGNWLFSLLSNSVVLYRQKAWLLKGAYPEGTEGSLQLQALEDSEQNLLLIYRLEEGVLSLSEGSDTVLQLSREATYDKVPNPINPPSFETVLSSDSAWFSGYLLGYSPDLGEKTGMVYVDNILSGNQVGVLIEINDKGFFRVQLPVLSPGEVFVRSRFFNRSFFVEPGTETMLFLDLTKGQTPMVMGANARVNEEMWMSSPFYMSRFYREIDEYILDMDPDGYKAFCLKKMAADLKKLEAMSAQGNRSDRYLQVMQFQIHSYYLRNILHYRHISEGAYRNVHKVPRTQRNLPVSYELPIHAGWYDFIPAEMANEEQWLLGSSFENFVNAFKYCNLMHNSRLNRYDLGDLLVSLSDTALVQAEDRPLVQELSALYTGEYKALHKAYLEEAVKENDNVELRLIQANQRLIEDVVTNRDPDSDQHVLQSFFERLAAGDSMAAPDVLSAADLAFCKYAVDYFSHPLVVAVSRYHEENKQAINDFWGRYSAYRIDFLHTKRVQVLTDSLGFEAGLLGDLLLSQDLLSGVVENFTPLSPARLAHCQAKLQHPFVRNYLATANEATIAKIAANKEKGSFVLHEAPETLEAAGLDSGRLFAALMDKYKGKVVYVDFWATWCGPCRSAMEQQKAMKTSLKERDIVFVYLTNQSSPEQTYNNMIPDIGGEHYRLSDDQWRVLSSRFGVNGIPHYLIVNKAGDVVDHDASRDPSVLLPVFEKLMAE